MSSNSHSTTEHDESKSWVAEQDGPVSAKGTETNDAVCVLQMNFSGGAGSDDFEEITRFDWFERFEQKNLAILSQQEKVSGEESTFLALVSH